MYQFCSSDWEEIHFGTEKDEIEDVLQTNIEECLSAECFEEEDSNSRESLSLAEYAYNILLSIVSFYNIFKILNIRQYFSHKSEG